MTIKASWLFTLVGSLVLIGVASAQGVPTAGAAQPAAVQSPIQANAIPASLPPDADIDLAQIFKAPASEGISTVPAPSWKTCTMLQCKMGCSDCRLMFHCLPICLDVSTCECGCACDTPQ